MSTTTEGPGVASAEATSLVDLDGDALRALVPGERPVAAQPGWTLGIHRNTVRRRIARAGELLDADLGDPYERAELWPALKWL